MQVYDDLGYAKPIVVTNSTPERKPVLHQVRIQRERISSDYYYIHHLHRTMNMLCWSAKTVQKKKALFVKIARVKTLWQRAETALLMANL